MLTMPDSRGNPSSTRPLILTAFTIVCIKFLFAGLTLPHFGVVPAMSGVDFAAALGAVLGMWNWREKIAKAAGQ